MATSMTSVGLPERRLERYRPHPVKMICHKARNPIRKIKFWTLIRIDRKSTNETLSMWKDTTAVANKKENVM
jgi:hypothetical protein